MNEGTTTKGATMKIVLEHAPNPDITDGGYWEPCDCPYRQVIELQSLQGAQMVLLGWIRSHGLGGGNMTKECGVVYDDGKAVARVSYSGRVWTPHDWGHPDRKEIAV